MAYDALLVSGTRLYYSMNDGGSWTELPDLKEMGPPGTPEGPDVDVTPLADNSNFRQFRIGLYTTGDLEVKQYFTKARRTWWLAAVNTRIMWKVTYPDNANPASCSHDKFYGYVKKVARSESRNPDDPVTIDSSIKLSSAPTFVEGS